MPARNRRVPVYLLVLLLACMPAAANKVLHEQRSLYSNIVIKQAGDRICLLFSVRRDQRNQSCMNTRKPREMVFAYTRMSMTALLFHPNPESALIVGLGGGTLPTALRELYPDLEIDALEIDPEVIKLAGQYFGFKEDQKLRAHAQDARIWIRRAALRAKTFDIIVLDAFNGEYIPEHLMTQEFFREVKAVLASDGVLISNTFAISKLYDHESATYASVFGDFINFQLPESANRVIVAPQQEVSDTLLGRRADMLADRLKPYAVPIQRYARLLRRQRNKRPDWDTDARIFTDQYSPANLLQAR